MASKSNQKSKILQNSWTGGIAQGSKSGYINSFQDGVGIDYQTDPDYITALPKLTKESGSNVTDLVKFIITNGSDDYMYGDTGKIYKRTSVPAYSNPKTVSSSHGNGFEIFNNALWYAGDASIGKATDLSGSPVYTDDYFKSLANNLEAQNNNNASTYTTLTSISEVSTNKYTFTASGAVIIGLQLNITTKGTGTVSVTLHDSSNNVQAIASLATGSITSGKFHYFAFTPVKLTASASYHFHVTSTVNDTVIVTQSSGDLSTVQVFINKSYNDLDKDQTKNLIISTALEAIATPSAIDETSTKFVAFVPNYTTLAAISFWARGTSGTFTITVHDSNNNLVGSASTNSFSTGAFNRVSFATALTLIPGANYHFHITSTTSETITAVSTTLSTGMYFMTHFAVLVSDTNYHMAKVFLNKLCFGNGQFLFTCDDSEVINPETLTLPQGETVRCIETIGDYLAISTWKGTLDDAKSRIYFWDGTSPTINSFVDIDGVVNAMKNDGINEMTVIHGTQMNISVYTGAITKVRRVKYIQNAYKSYVNPGAIDTLEGLLYFGNNATTNAAIDTLVYSYGHKDKDFPMSLNKNFPISPGNKGITVTIGAILGKSADHFLVAWKDTTSDTVYGVDLLDTNPQVSVNYVSLRTDRGFPELQKHGHDVSIRCFPIIAGQKITIEYRLNNILGWNSLGTIGSTTASPAVDVGIHYRNFNLDKLFFEIEFKVTLEAGAGIAAPIFYQIAIDDELLTNFRIDDQTT